MIILDTNVISELMRQKRDMAVEAWFRRQKTFNLYTTSINVAEIQRGLKRLPAGKKRVALEENFVNFVQQGFEKRVLSFDADAAYSYGVLSAECEAQGDNIDVVDLMIAAIGKMYNAKIATRNVKDFKPCGVKVIDPWAD